MMSVVSESSPDSVVGRPSENRWLFGLALLIVLVVSVEMPLLWNQPAQLDEAYFAVPGLTILESGIPRIPYMPSRNVDGAFCHADVALFTLPPAYFYWEALWFAAAGPELAVARWSSLFWMIAATILIYALGRAWVMDPFGAFVAAGLFLLGRSVMLPGMTARPDMMCCALGFGALWCADRWQKTERWRWSALAGLCVGLAAITHPFAIVFALQVAVLLTWGSPGTKRLIGIVVAASFAVAMVGLWSPLIWAYPREFQSQFFNNVVHRSGPGLFERIVWPWDEMAYQTPMFVDRVGWYPTVLLVAGMISAAAIAVSRATTNRETGATLKGHSMPARSGSIAGLAGSSLWLMAASLGTHTNQGYWCFPVGLLCLCVGSVVSEVRRTRPWMASIIVLVAFAVMLPLEELRTATVYLRHWDDHDYNARLFKRTLLAETPPDARVIVDPAYVFDFYRSGRRVTLGLNFPFFFDCVGVPYDMLVVGPSMSRDQIPEILRAVPIKTFGDTDDPRAHRATLYVAPTEQ